MDLPVNQFKKAIQQRRMIYGTWLVSGSPAAAEALGSAGYDFLVVDTEHTPIETTQAAEIMRTIAGTGASSSPKFHCELSPIEMVWASAKRCFRNNCKYEYGKGFKKLVVESLDSVTVHHMRAFDRHCHRYINVYTAGGDIAQAEIARASKKKTSHRVIPDNSDLVAKGAYREAWERPG